MSKSETATKIGIAKCLSISEEGMKFISEWDSDLHYTLVKARKKKGVKAPKSLS